MSYMCYTGFMIVNNRGSSHFKVCVRCNWMEINLCTPVGLRILLLGTNWASDIFLNSTGLCHQNIEKYFSWAPLLFMYYTVLLRIPSPPHPSPSKNFNCTLLPSQEEVQIGEHWAERKQQQQQQQQRWSAFLFQTLFYPPWEKRVLRSS